MTPTAILWDGAGWRVWYRAVSVDADLAVANHGRFAAHCLHPVIPQRVLSTG